MGAKRGAGQVGVGGPLMAEDPDRDPHPRPAIDLGGRLVGWQTTARD
jgi:hypothetical protein